MVEHLTFNQRAAGSIPARVTTFSRFLTAFPALDTQSRRGLVARLQQLTPEDWQRTGEHGEYSHYSVLIMFRHLAFHDFFHAHRIEEVLLKKEWTAEWRAFTSRR